MRGDRMQISRLFKIVYILLDKDKVSAKELAAHFEVSARTIYRDIEILSASGIPVYMSKGRNGGISLLPNFILNKTVLTAEEKDNILSALYSINTFDETLVESTLSKLGLFFGKNNTSFFEIDYSDWGNLIKEQFEKSKEAILARKLLSFDYVSAQNKSSRRMVEPYVLWFKDKTWYLKAFCLDKNELRSFRFSRMRNVVVTDKIFVPRDIALKVEKEDLKYNYPTSKIVMRIEADKEYRVLDEFHENNVIRNTDGSFTVTMNFVEDEWVYGYILSYGSSATVLEPERVRNIIKTRLEENLKNYL
jgi:predicted DNA-binding transcriptional regulator YafY